MADNTQSEIGKILVEQGLVSKEQLDKALKEQQEGHFIAEEFIKSGLVDSEKLASTLSEELGLAYIDLAEMTIEPKAIELVPEPLCLKFSIMPLYIMNNTITLAMANALDKQAIDEVAQATGLQVRPAFASYTAIQNAIRKNYQKEGIDVETLSEGKVFSEETPSAYEKFQQSDESAPQTEKIDSLKEAASLAPVIDMVNNIVTKAVEIGASDIHIEPERTYLGYRFRSDGILQKAEKIPFEYQAAVISRIKIMANLDIAEKRLPQDGRIQMYIKDKEVDLRVSTFPTIHGENVVIRILDRSSGILKLKQIGFSEQEYKRFHSLIERPYGIILVTGPTGSGKTTTLYGALSEIDATKKNIITLEDPVEYEIENVRQSQVNVKAGLTFASGLRSIVRQDPDIIMIGEIRDKETADIAIHAALTGHLVFSTLHTNNAPSAATRLIDMGVEPFLIASSIIGILAQRLVRTLCPACKKEYKPTRDIIKRLGLDKLKSTEKSFYKETGCAKCKGQGYSGRTGIFELLIPNDRIKELISQRASAVILSEEAVKNGMKTLHDAGLEKAALGITSISEVLRVTEEAS